MFSTRLVKRRPVKEGREQGDRYQGERDMGTVERKDGAVGKVNVLGSAE
tara:strand:+ start:183 stop:329 length:147 start_codon:yes stop_codon:yes gene_type:complete